MGVTIVISAILFEAMCLFVAIILINLDGIIDECYKRIKLAEKIVEIASLISFIVIIVGILVTAIEN